MGRKQKQIGPKVLEKEYNKNENQKGDVCRIAEGWLRAKVSPGGETKWYSCSKLKLVWAGPAVLARVVAGAVLEQMIQRAGEESVTHTNRARQF